MGPGRQKRLPVESPPRGGKPQGKRIGRYQHRLVDRIRPDRLVTGEILSPDMETEPRGGVRDLEPLGMRHRHPGKLKAQGRKPTDRSFFTGPDTSPTVTRAQPRPSARHIPQAPLHQKPPLGDPGALMPLLAYELPQPTDEPPQRPGP